MCVKDECMCVKDECMYVKGECMCVRQGKYVFERRMYVCERRMYVCERRMYVCERARMNYVLYGPSYSSVQLTAEPEAGGNVEWKFTSSRVDVNGRGLAE